jgi:hypothetical protein
MLGEIGQIDKVPGDRPGCVDTLGPCAALPIWRGEGGNRSVALS